MFYFNLMFKDVCFIIFRHKRNNWLHILLSRFLFKIFVIWIILFVLFFTVSFFHSLIYSSFEYVLNYSQRHSRNRHGKTFCICHPILLQVLSPYTFITHQQFKLQMVRLSCLFLGLANLYRIRLFSTCNSSEVCSYPRCDSSGWNSCFHPRSASHSSKRCCVYRLQSNICS